MGGDILYTTDIYTSYNFSSYASSWPQTFMSGTILNNLKFQEISVPNTPGSVWKILSSSNENKNVPYRNLKNLQMQLSSFLLIKNKTKN